MEKLPKRLLEGAGLVLLDLVVSLSIEDGATVFASVEVGFNLSLLGPINLVSAIRIWAFHGCSHLQSARF